METPTNSNEEEEFSYQELYESTILAGEIIVTIPASEEEKTKVGLKNHKAKIAAKAKEDDMPVDRSLLNFSSQPSEDYPDCIDLRIVLKRPATVKVMKIVIPEQLPD